MATLGIPQNTIAVLQKYNFTFQKKYGQNFLIDSHVLEKIMDAAEIGKDDCVVEIGPGIGTMTQYLAESAGQVIAVEIDKSLIPILEDTLSDYDNARVINNDVLKVDIAKLAEEDPSFRVKSDTETGQTIISGMGELHLDIIVDRLRREFGVDINQGAPQVNYKEAITATTTHREVFKKQTGGRGKFADIIVEIGPADEGVTGLQFENAVKGGNVPKEFVPCVQKGFESAMANGVLAGYEVPSLKVTLLDGSFHPVDSDQLSFEICARMAFRHACPKAHPVLLEPIMNLEVVTPEEYMGDIVGDLNRRRGQINAMDSTANGARIIKAFVPLSEQFGYVTVLRTLSSGRATSTMSFDHYAEVPANLAKEVIEKSGYKASDDDE